MRKALKNEPQNKTLCSVSRVQSVRVFVCAEEFMRIQCFLLLRIVLRVRA